MKFLFFKTNLFMQEDWFDSLCEAGYEVDPVTYVFLDFLKDDFFAGKLERRLRKIQYDAVLSFDFFPVISDVCKKCEVPYISWIHDSPIPNFFRFDTPYNQIYAFDKYEVSDYQDEGYQMVHHLPLAVNVKRLDRQLGVFEQMPEYHHDISFVGSLYSGHTMAAFDLTPSEYVRGVFEGYAAAQTQFFDQDIVRELLETSEFFQKDFFNRDFPWKYFIRLMHEEATAQERSHILKKLSEKFTVDLYTSGTVEKTERLRIHPPIDYYTKMPEIFRNSRINLNMNYRAIRSGMSARILDIMGSGGFLMTTPQPELFDYFIEDVDFVAFRSLEELEEKCAYYLQYEEERFQIAKNGYQKIKERHTYEARFPELFASL